MRIIAILLVMLFCFLPLCVQAEEDRLQIVAVNFPCYDFARAIVQDQADVTLLIRPGMEVHTFDPTPADIVAIGNADLLVYIGGESDVWVDDVLSSLGEKAPEQIKLMDSVKLLEELEPEEASDQPEMDEHIWTSPRNALQMVEALLTRICEIDPTKQMIYAEYASIYQSEIEAIDSKLIEIIENGARKELIFADRFPFLYLAHDYGLDYKAAFLSCPAQTEPSANTVISLIQTVIQNKIPVIYTIEMSNGAIAKTIQQETGAKIEQLHSMQTITLDEFEAGDTYVSIMNRNLEAIWKGLN
ncbi:MAG: zinc ABC transporter substrate-binding protein [Clostridia bacterium]|nr:zinc ABC transporter substrate-binding protein [Clostridia bacterium]